MSKSFICTKYSLFCESPFAALPHGPCSSGTLWYHPDSSDRTTTGETNECRRQCIFGGEKAMVEPMNEQAYQFKTWLNVIYDIVWKIWAFLWPKILMA